MERLASPFRLDDYAQMGLGWRVTLKIIAAFSFGLCRCRFYNEPVLAFLI